MRVNRQQERIEVHPPRESRSPLALTIRHITAIFLQGLIALLPLIVTVFVLGWLGYAAERTLGVVIKWLLADRWYVLGRCGGSGGVAIFLFGLIINVYGVPGMLHLGERAIGRVPLVKTIYGGVRDLLGFFSQPGREGSVSKVVIVTFGSTGARMVGLVTRESFDDLPEGFADSDHVVVYIPYSYQIGGFSMIVPRSAVQPIDMSLEDAMRYIVTAGAKAMPKP